jgi:hypothetical protein
MQRPAKFLVAIIAGLSFALVSAELRAGPYVIEEAMSGLVTPRGLAFGPDGGLYVAEAGSGGDGPGIVLGSGNEAFLGATSGLSRLLGGVQERVLDGLPSVATAAGLEANGLADIAFDANGQAYGLFGLGANPALRNSNLGDAGAPLGTIVRMTLDGTGTLTPIADVSDYELANNPDGTTVDSNPFDLPSSDCCRRRDVAPFVAGSAQPRANWTARFFSRADRDLRRPGWRVLHRPTDRLSISSRTGQCLSIRPQDRRIDRGVHGIHEHHGSRV